MGLLDNVHNFAQGASNSAASNITAPVDGIAWLLRKAGLPIPSAPLGGSDWAAQRGLTRPANGVAGLLGEAIGGVAPMLAVEKAPQIARGLLQIGENAMKAPALNKQAGVITMGKAHPKIISSQRYIDGSVVEKKIKNGDFTVSLSKPFEIDGELVQSIEDGHHAYQAAIQSGVKPKFVTQTTLQNDRNLLIDSGRIDDFLNQSYVDSPWRYFDTDKELF